MTLLFEFLPNFTQHFSQLLEDADNYDIIIKVGESAVKEFHAHSTILRARSLYFNRALSKNWVTKKDNMIYLNIPNTTPTIFDMIIRYIYTGTLDLNGKTGTDILDLLVISDELLLEELTSFTQKYLIKNQTEWLQQQNFINVINTAFQLETCKQLQDYCLKLIRKDPEPFLRSNYSSLNGSVIFGLLKSEDLLIEEIELWNYLIRWGIIQTELREKDMVDLSDWNEKDFIVLENTLNQFIVHIRFFEISSKDFNDKVRPFKKVIPEELFEDILSFHLANAKPRQMILAPRGGKVEIESSIINPNHAAILASWIHRIKANARILKDNKYSFDLIYRESKGQDINTIRNKCNNKGACILIIKIKEKDTIIGGYNPVGWNCYSPSPRKATLISRQENWVNTSESFIFSSCDRNGKDFKNFTISRVVNNNKAICLTNALNFGNSDLVIYNNMQGTCVRKYYENSILDIDRFTITEMEIFNVLCDNEFAQGSSNSDRAKWDDKCYEALKMTLEQFIPLIRFSDIGSADFFDKVRPYRSVIPQQIYEEIIEFHMKQTLPKTNVLPKRFRNVIRSNLIKQNSRDGLNDQSFQKMFNDQDPFIVLVKQKSSAKIYGGYNPLGGRECFASESFIFSFEIGKDITNMNVSRFKTPKKIYRNNTYNDKSEKECYNRFNFGDTLYIDMNSQYVKFVKNTGYYDENCIHSTSIKFIPEEIEVFKVKKKDLYILGKHVRKNLNTSESY
ncbi:19211_t:CDS:2 [Funneliformis geosporum]|uniref:19211_t:CDS:1 n=1 Tax=Funneliformis geosporum TaxID=1117311 RepID=A0A9W4SNS8_9GLOM|nr:19211_t:CDS:2 [Funneliformis geosporum]